MVLATRCPHCRTTFRVVQDQLKLRGGLVRCGACKEIFNGTENLLRPIDAKAGSPRPPATDATDAAAPSAAASAAATVPAAASGQAPADSSPSPSSSPPVTATAAAPAPAASQPDPLLRMTLMDFSPYQEEAEETGKGEPEARPEPNAPASTDYSLPRMAAAPAPAATPAADNGDDLARAIDDMKSKPWRGMTRKRAPVEEDAIDALDSAEPDFVVRARHRQRVAQSCRVALLAGSVFLALLLAVQLLVQFRVPLAAQSPAAATMLTGLCRLFGCTIGLPAQIDMVTIESSELQALPGSTDTFTLLALLRNRSASRQQWPHLELTLNDAGEAAVARRVIAPRDYLPPSQSEDEGFAPNSEQSARLVFSLAQAKAAGFRVYVFYP
nr:DUF3426 domain-containing protein [uncultured Noviherbaspirillum sp.]